MYLFHTATLGTLSLERVWMDPQVWMPGLDFPNVVVAVIHPSIPPPPLIAASSWYISSCVCYVLLDLKCRLLDGNYAMHNNTPIFKGPFELRPIEWKSFDLYDTWKRKKKVIWHVKSFLLNGLNLRNRWWLVLVWDDRKRASYFMYDACTTHAFGWNFSTLWPPKTIISPPSSKGWKFFVFCAQNK